MIPIRPLAFAVLAVGAAGPVRSRDFACAAGQGQCPRQIDDAAAGTPVQSSSGLTLTAAACDGGKARVVGVAADVAHNAIGDLRLELVAPNGSAVLLLNRLAAAAGPAGSCHGDDFATRFVAGTTAPAPVCDAARIPALAAEVRAQGNLGALANLSPAGTWQLRITDAESGGYGLLRDWTLQLECSPLDALFADGFE